MTEPEPASASERHLELLTAIGAALRLDAPYAELGSERAEVIHLGSGTQPPVGASLEVLGGAVGSDGRVGWIEQRSAAPHANGYLAIEIDVRIVVEGRLHVSALATYNPYFGCSVHFAQWIGDGFTFVYSEKHQTILARIPGMRGSASKPNDRLISRRVLQRPHHAWPRRSRRPRYTTQQLITLLDSPRLVDSRIVDLDDWQGLLNVRRLVDGQAGISVLTPVLREGDIPPTQRLELDERGVLELAILASRDVVPEWKQLDWADLHEARWRLAERLVIPLPPDRLLPRSATLRERWIGLLRGVPEVERVVDALGAPWLAPERPTCTYGRNYRRRSTLGASLPAALRAGLPREEVIYGWPGEGRFDERLDRVFLAAVTREAIA